MINYTQYARLTDKRAKDLLLVQKRIIDGRIVAG